MPRSLHRLTATTVKNVKRPGLHSDGGGLYLRVAPTGAKSWVFRFTLHGRARYLGLGSASAVKLQEARQAAERARSLRGNSIDPIEAKKSARKHAEIAEVRKLSFKSFAEDYVSAHEQGWKNLKHRREWRTTLKTYVYPTIGHLAPAEINTDHVLKILNPIWSAKPQTASRVRGRIESILDAAKARQAYNSENPARWRGHLSNLLPKTSKLVRVRHHPALPYAEIPEFLHELRSRDGLSARALEFTILTAARTGEVLGAQWSEIDLINAIWTIPAVRMKGGKEHRVPLTPRVMAIVTELKTVALNDFVFPGWKPGRPLNALAMAEMLKRMGRTSITVHGFRSTFRDWAAETTNVPNFVVEMALAHAVDNKVEGAYRRGELLEKRRNLMEAFSQYCAQKSTVERSAPGVAHDF